MYVVHTQSSLFSCVISLGELLGVEYLYSQTGKVLQDMGSYQSETDDGEEKPDEEEHGEEEDDDEGFGDIEGFVDFTIPPLNIPSQAPPQQSTPKPKQAKPLLRIPPMEEYRQDAVSTMYTC